MLLRLQGLINLPCLGQFGIDWPMKLEHCVVGVQVQKIDGFDYKPQVLVTLENFRVERHTDESQKLVVIAASRQDHRHFKLDVEMAHKSALLL